MLTSEQFEECKKFYAEHPNYTKMGWLISEIERLRAELEMAKFEHENECLKLRRN